MKRLSWLLLTLSLVFALTGAALAAGSPVRFVGAVGPAQARPGQLALTGDGTLEVGGVTWGAWGGSRATGAGTAEFHGCTPTCGAAKTHHALVAITLSNVRVCKGRRYYTHVALRQHSGKLLDARFLRISWNPCAGG